MRSHWRSHGDDHDEHRPDRANVLQSRGWWDRKGHLVREIDALGGIMGELTDAVGIQFRLLNTSRGPAVWSPRAQCDKKQYRLKMRELLESEPNLRILQAEVAGLSIDQGRVRGVILRDGRTLHSSAVVVTTGTFLEWIGPCWRHYVQLWAKWRGPSSAPR